MNAFKRIALACLLLTGMAFGQGNYTAPALTAGTGLTLNYGTGTVFQGGEPKSITGATLTMTDNLTNCATPAFSSCNIVYWTAGTSLSVTTAIATANASGNVIVGYVKTSGGAITTITHANVNYPTPAGVGALTGLTSNITPAVAGAVTVGTNALPFGSLFLGTAATNNMQFLPAATAAARIINLCDEGATPILCLSDPSDLTKQIIFHASGMTTGKVATVAAASANSRTYTLPDPGGNATFFFSDATTSQNLKVNAFKVADNTDTTKQMDFVLSGATTGTVYHLAASPAGTVTATLPAAGGGIPLGTTCGTIAANGACANTALGGTAHFIAGIATLAGNSSTITGISPAFTSANSYFCVANDITTRANPVQAIPASGSTVTFTNTTGATDNIQFICVGN
jgi:hypothetical protein